MDKALTLKQQLVVSRQALMPLCLSQKIRTAQKLARKEVS
jgi:hypothetical protein